MSRLSIDLTEQQHQSLKALAALQGKTIRQYAVERLFQPLTEGDEAAWRDLKALLAQRIAEGLAGEVSDKTFDEIAAQELGSDAAA
jgi:Antitoxin ParD